ncbi:hypothetical protein BDV95DRAFT_201141 [Massariosphaeria phaeospora]|uniref:Uncharacterized protein n=1 Tax=Massariosphaeria phaeospora TaxID=100035 RepID=A0A7C8I2N3_9PLEO|nr:hypothetical protein BDV95DRAFT_201141 [Massariosphaeria phaeospora]
MFRRALTQSVCFYSPSRVVLVKFAMILQLHMSYPMSFITRTQPTTDETPPWAGIAFDLPIDSDVLSDQLKKAYPTCRTLRQRKHKAAIDFLVHELHQMQSKDSIFLSSSDNNPGQRYLGSPKGESEELDDTNKIASPRQSLSYCNSPSLSSSMHTGQILQSNSPNAERPSPTQPDSSKSPGKQFVFSALDGRTMQPKRKRKMTVQERGAYKETRKRGACLKCRRQKGRVLEFSSFDTKSYVSYTS